MVCGQDFLKEISGFALMPWSKSCKRNRRIKIMDMTIRPRRLRSSETLRRMVRETRLSPASLIYPMFVMDGKDTVDEIPSLPGLSRNISCPSISAEIFAFLIKDIASSAVMGDPFSAERLI